MDDKKNQPSDDEIFDEDLELEDFEDLDEDLEDLSDEAWDEYDDLATAEDIDGDMGENFEAGAMTPPVKKSFISRHFNLIVIGVALVIGGPVILSQLGGSPQPQSTPPAQEQQSTQDDFAQDDGSGLPPMPAPMQKTDDDIIGDTQQPDNTDLSDVPNDAGNLTPMPDLAGLKDTDTTEESGLPPLSIEEVAGIPAAPVDPEKTEEDGIFSFDPKQDLGPAIEDIEPEQEIAEILPPKESVPDDMGMAPMPAPAPMAEATNVDMSAFENRFENLEEQIQKGASASDEKIAALESTLGRLEGQLTKLLQEQKTLRSEISAAEEAAGKAARTANEAKSAAAERPVAVETPAVKLTPAPVPAPVASPAPAAKPKVTPKPATAAAATATQWELRSATPGQAVLGKKGGGDVRSVNVGDTIDGLGRISSIAVENGRWVVRGSQGQVTR